MNDDQIPFDDQALDTLLDETLGNLRPPDLSEQILKRLADHDQHRPDVSAVTITTAQGRAASGEGARGPVAVIVGVVAAVAASILLAAWLRLDRNTQPPTLTKTIIDTPETESLATAEPTPKPGPGASPPAQPRIPKPSPPKGIPMEIVQIESPSSPLDADAPPKSGDQPPLRAVTLVSTRLNDRLHRYWESIGIQPSEEASDVDVLKRLEVALGVRLPAELVGQTESLYAEIARREVAVAIAASWLNEITDGGLGRVDDQARQSLIEELAACFHSRQAFDQTLVGWINGTSSNAAAFYRAVSSGAGRARNDSAMIRRIASLTMNVDLRCTRCHDSYIEGSGREHDYWAFAAFVGRGVSIGPQGQLRIDAPPGRGKAQEYFYELPDGRQRHVEPAVSESWLPSRQSITTVKSWSQALIGSESLARGVVNSLWQLIHGRPLHGRAVDPLSAPHSDSLGRVEEELVTDLLGSEFDLGRALTLIISSPATWRQVPDSLQPQNAFVADEAAVRSANSAVDAFAAAMPLGTTLSLNDRVDQAMRATGATLDSQGRPFVAQLGHSTGSVGKADPKENSLSEDFPVPTEALPVQWLGRIRDGKSQVEHLGYLAGRTQVPESVMRAAETMRQADGTATALHRVWWMLKP